MSDTARRLGGCLDLRQRQSRVIEKGSAGVRQLHTMRAADKQWYADLVFEISDLTTQRGLGRMQPLARRHREAACLGDCDEVAEMAQFHAVPHACEV